ncbi:MAG: hypothetical protein ACI4XI_04740 [Ruminococcus sp.]
MKRFISAIIIAVFLAGAMSGCSENNLKIDNSDTYVFNQDSQENFIRYGSQLYFAEGDKGIYFLNTDNGFLYVIDKATHKCQPLCNRSDCMHDRETSFEKKQECTAFLNISFKSLVYYNDSIYFQTVEDKTDKDGVSYELNEICKISADGTNREIVYSTRECTIWSFKIHRGYIYYEGSKKDTEGAAKGSNTALYKVSADGKGDTTELLPYYKYDIQKGMSVCDTRFYGNHLFLWITKLDGTKENSYLINYDLQTDKWENLSEKLKVNINSMFTIFNDKLIFANGSKVYECEFSGENQKEILDCSELLGGYQYYPPFTNDGENLIISAANDENEADKLIFCDKSYKATLKNMPFEFTAEIGCDNTCFVDYNEEEKTLYYIDKSNTENAEKIYTFDN